MKTKTKILIVTMIALFAVLISATSVKATGITDEALLNAIPEEITLDIPEIDYAKAKNIIENKIKEILKEKQLNISNEDFSVNYYNIYGGMNNFIKQSYLVKTQTIVKK